MPLLFHFCKFEKSLIMGAKHLILFIGALPFKTQAVWPGDID